MAEDATEQAEKVEKPKTSTGTLTQLYLGLVWLGTTMWAAHATLTGPGGDDGTGAFGAAVSALPGVVAAMLLTSASIASAAGSRFDGPVKRLLAGLGLGLVFGVVAAVAIRLAYGSEKSIMVLAVTVAAASVVGGATAILPTAVLEAGLWATTFVFFAGVIFGVLQPQILNLLGGGPTATGGEQAAALSRFPLIQSVLTGLLAGYFALRPLRSERPARLWYLIGGAFAGALLLAAEALTILGGKSLLDVVNQTALVGLSDSARVKHAVIVLVVGGVVALVAGLATKPAKDDD